MLRTEPIRVLIADDHVAMREGLANLLSMEEDIEVVGQASDGPSAVRLARNLKPRVILMDIRMGEMDGLAATREVLSFLPDAAVIMLTMYDKDEYLFAAVKEGAIGYILKDVPSAEVVRAVRAAAAGKSLLDPNMARKLMAGFAALSRPRTERGPSPELSEREREVLQLLGRGLSNRDIGQQLFISETTVKKHVANIMEKMGVKSRSQAVITGVQLGLIDMPRPEVTRC